tara:strand:+ start:307 stop:1365 length:1059 start_codon:yes stop_codon:yes gene_type:complete
MLTFVIHSLALASSLPTAQHVNPATALRYLSGACGSLTGVGCNSYQQPLFNGQSFIPDLVLQATKSDVIVDPTQHRQSDCVARLDQAASLTASSTSKSFGISGSVPNQGTAFSASAQAQSVAQNMDTYSTMNYYGEISRSYVVFSAKLADPATLPRAADFAAEAATLPSQNSTNFLPRWFDFFTKWGTHYVTKVEFGGVMRMTTFLSSTVREDTSVQKANWNFNLGAAFDNEAGINVSWDSQHTQEEYSNFENYLTKTNFFAIGGDQSVSNYDQWMQTVKANPAPISTTLAPLSELLPSSTPFAAALEAYFSRCPHTPTQGVCNGYGSCGFSTGTCTCTAPSTYLDDSDGNC